jgi:hypothetical protein
MNGWIAEVYFTNAKQTTADRQKNEGYLAWKWGLQGNLDPTHPYKSAAPYVAPVIPISIGDSVGSGTAKSVLFIDSAGKLAQDNPHFTFDPVTNYLDLGISTDTGVYYLNSVPCLYQVRNVSGNNWFEGNAGNLSITGHGNFGTGDGVMANLTSGSGNMGIGGAGPSGLAPLNSLTTASGNMAVGPGALSRCVTGDQNTAIGSGAMELLVSDRYNVALGQSCLQYLGNSSPGLNSGNVGIGHAVASSMSVGQGNTFIGDSVGNNLIGVTASNVNTFIGGGAGLNMSNSNYVTILGPWKGVVGTIANDVIAISSGRGLNYPALDKNLCTTDVWSFLPFMDTTGNATGIHIYKTADATPPTNFERAILDWNATSNIFRIGSQAGGTGTVRLIAIDGFQKAGAPAAGDLPSGTYALINDTSGGQTWLCYNAAGTIRKVQLT